MARGSIVMWGRSRGYSRDSPRGLRAENQSRAQSASHRELVLPGPHPAEQEPSSLARPDLRGVVSPTPQPGCCKYVAELQLLGPEWSTFEPRHCRILARTGGWDRTG